MRALLPMLAGLAIVLPTQTATGQYVGKYRCSAACMARVKARVHRKQVRAHYLHRLHTIQPYTAWLEKTGACESGTGSYDLSVGLRAISPGGTYRGRYQFDMDSWARAGGSGDPVAANWLEQAYRAVVWLKMVGNGAWPVCGH